MDCINIIAFDDASAIRTVLVSFTRMRNDAPILPLILFAAAPGLRSMLLAAPVIPTWR